MSMFFPISDFRYSDFFYQTSDRVCREVKHSVISATWVECSMFVLRSRAGTTEEEDKAEPVSGFYHHAKAYDQLLT